MAMYSSGMESPMFGTCYTKYSNATNSNDDLLLCMTQTLDVHITTQQASYKSWFLTLNGIIIFLMQLGFAMLCAGAVRRKNVTNTLLKNVLDAVVTIVGFYSFGYAIAFGGDNPMDGPSFIGTKNFFLINLNPLDYSYWFFQFCFAAANVTIIAGTLAERCQMTAYFAYSFVMASFIYPVIARLFWSTNGYISPFAANPYRGIGSIDFAGSGVVHLLGGTTSLVAAIIIGPRKGRFTNSKGEKLDIPREIPGHSIPFQVLGFIILWCGWYSFNCGSALLLPKAVNQGMVAGRAAVNVSIAGGAGGITAMLIKLYFGIRNHHGTGHGVTGYDINSLMNGSMSGLVAVTAGCATIDPSGAIVIGVVAGFLYIGASNLLVRFCIDDAIDGIPIHMVNGAWGIISTGLLSTPSAMLAAYGTNQHVGWFYSMKHTGTMDGTLLVNQIIGLCCILGWTIVTMTPFFLTLYHMKWLRVTAEKEIIGLDASCMHAPEEDPADVLERVQNELRRHREAMESKSVQQGTSA